MSQSSDISSIKSRMAWQLGLQTATLLAVGNLNKSVKNQTDIIGGKIDDFKNDTVDKLSDIESTIQSLEISLINGIEELKWILGSIDQKFSKLIGLIEYSNATDSSEKFKIGFELYKQGFYEKSLMIFEESVNLNPLNLNSLVGVYLCKKEKKEIDTDLINDIIKLTKSDFLYNTEKKDEYKKTSINYFINFCFSELIMNNDYEKIISTYENDIEEFSKEDLGIKIKYSSSIILSGKKYDKIINDFLLVGKLQNLLMFMKYEKNNIHVVSFLSDLNSIITKNIPELKYIKDFDHIIQKKSFFLFESLRNDPKLIIDFACNKNNLDSKIKKLKIFFDSSDNFHTKMTQIDSSIKTKEELLNTVKIISKPTFPSFSDSFLIKVNNEIKNEFDTIYNRYMKKNIKEYKSDVDKLKLISDKSKKEYPKFDDDSEECYEITNRFLKNINLNKKEVIIDKLF